MNNFQCYITFVSIPFSVYHQISEDFPCTFIQYIDFSVMCKKISCMNFKHQWDKIFVSAVIKQCARGWDFFALLMRVQIKPFVYKNSVQGNLKRSKWEIIAAVSGMSKWFYAKKGVEKSDIPRAISKNSFCIPGLYYIYAPRWRRGYLAQMEFLRPLSRAKNARRRIHLRFRVHAAHIKIR